MPEPTPAAPTAEPETTAAWEGDRTRGAVELEAGGDPALTITARDLRRANETLESLVRLYHQPPRAR